MLRRRIVGNVLRNLCGVAILFSVTSTLAASPRAGQACRIHLESGRIYTATIDARTNDRLLWLRFTGPSTVVLRPVQWERVARVEAPDDSYSSFEFQQVAWEFIADVDQPEADDPRDDETATDETERQPFEYESDVAPTSDTDQRTFAELALDSLITTKVSSIDVDAYVANWDDDVEVDGLVVDMWPHDAQGDVVPVNGTVHVELIAQRTGVTRRQRRFQTIGSWTRAVRPETVGAGGARFRFEFQASHPEFDLDLLSRGLVHVRFVAPGHGTFDASDVLVRIRPYSSVRDQRELRGEGRFFPTERTGRTH